MGRAKGKMKKKERLRQKRIIEIVRVLMMKRSNSIIIVTFTCHLLTCTSYEWSLVSCVKFGN